MIFQIRWVLAVIATVTVAAGLNLTTRVVAVAGEPLASDWVKGFHSRARLTAARLLRSGSGRGSSDGSADGMALFAGVDIKLDTSWKTYWKAPGDAGGLPPEFDWSASQNVKSAEVRYPVPKLYRDQNGAAIGYKDAVLFPVRVVPLDARRPVKLRLNVLYGVCDEICIPAEASLKLDIAPNARAAISVQRDLLTALDRVPSVSASSDTALGISKAEAVLVGKTPYLEIAARVPAGAKALNLYAIARDGSHVPMVSDVKMDGTGGAVFRFDLRHVEAPAVLSGKILDMTLVADGRGVQSEWTVPETP